MTCLRLPHWRLGHDCGLSRGRKYRQPVNDKGFVRPMLTVASPPFITRAARDVAGWVRCFELAALPILADTADRIEELRECQDDVDARMLANVIERDPLMTLKVLGHVAALRRGRGGSDTETATEALVMLGITPFFDTFGLQPTVEEVLADEPDALEGFMGVLTRAHRAANFAIAFAVHRMDHDAAVIHEAALLHDFAEMLLWVRAPALALQIQQRQTQDSSLRSADIQRELLGTELADLQHALMQTWRLPELLVRITDHRHAETVQVRNVLLAIRVARHSAAGWDNAALPDDMADIADLLNMGMLPTQRLLREVDGN